MRRPTSAAIHSRAWLTAEKSIAGRAPSVTLRASLVIFSGPVEETVSALGRGKDVAADTLLDSLFIPNVEPTLLALVARQSVGDGPAELDPVVILETLSVASTPIIAQRSERTTRIGSQSWR